VRPPERLPEATVQRMLAMAPHTTKGHPLEKKRTFWRNLASRFPTEEAFAAEYVYLLLRSESWEDLEAFEAQARSHRSERIDLIYVDVALGLGNIATAKPLLDAHIAAWGPSWNVLARAYALHLMMGDFAGAIEVTFRMGKPDDPLLMTPAVLRRRAVFYQRAHEQWVMDGTGPPDYDVYVINLDSDRLRMERTAKQLKGVPYVRVPGVRGAYLPNLILDAMTNGYGSRSKGTAGCFFSHIAAWERIAAAQRPGLVLEDDAWIVGGLPRRLASLRLPADFDYCFAAERMIPGGYPYRRTSFHVETLPDVLPTKAPGWVTASAAGYFMSPQGARLLLSRVARDGASADVDWRLMAYAMSPAERRALRKENAGSLTASVIGFHDHFLSKGRTMRGYVLVPALVRAFEGGSVRIFDNAQVNGVFKMPRKRPSKRRQARPLSPTGIPNRS
jgi:Glycosyltransferase family 25 (LPS biosynthesis protein)